MGIILIALEFSLPLHVKTCSFPLKPLLFLFLFKTSLLLLNFCLIFSLLLLLRILPVYSGLNTPWIHPWNEPSPRKTNIGCSLPSGHWHYQEDYGKDLVPVHMHSHYSQLLIICLSLLLAIYRLGPSHGEIPWVRVYPHGHPFLEEPVLGHTSWPEDVGETTWACVYSLRHPLLGEPVPGHPSWPEDLGETTRACVCPLRHPLLGEPVPGHIHHFKEHCVYQPIAPESPDISLGSSWSVQPEQQQPLALWASSLEGAVPLWGTRPSDLPQGLENHLCPRESSGSSSGNGSRQLSSLQPYVLDALVTSFQCHTVPLFCVCVPSLLTVSSWGALYPKALFISINTLIAYIVQRFWTVEQK